MNRGLWLNYVLIHHINEGSMSAFNDIKLNSGISCFSYLNGYPVACEYKRGKNECIAAHMWPVCARTVHTVNSLRQRCCMEHAAMQDWFEEELEATSCAEKYTPGK